MTKSKTKATLSMRRNNVYVDEPHKSSLASLILLTKDYSSMKFDEWMVFVNELFDECLAMNGMLRCAYCYKPNLVREVKDFSKRGQRYLATIDHITPIAKGGGVHDKNNCAIVCFTCNQAKKDKIMPLFVCDECHAIENTACGHYATRGCGFLKDKEADKKALCSECTPQEFSDGSRDYRKGKWHGRFEKQTATAELIKEMGEGNFVYVSDIEGVEAKCGKN